MTPPAKEGGEAEEEEASPETVELFKAAAAKSAEAQAKPEGWVGLSFDVDADGAVRLSEVAAETKATGAVETRSSAELYTAVVAGWKDCTAQTGCVVS